ncbi:hypothetical protein [Streptomyces niveiscabiei]|uniref:Uncharacterized protein n=1 Tax=Streptomyces niveiscabiei TaxID=164115 RepID=A0ABW9HMJ9_9ACTN
MTVDHVGTNAWTIAADMTNNSTLYAAIAIGHYLRWRHSRPGLLNGRRPAAAGCRRPRPARRDVDAHRRTHA